MRWLDFFSLSFPVGASAEGWLPFFSTLSFSTAARISALVGRFTFGWYLRAGSAVGGWH
jgi:hypothetical protein